MALRITKDLQGFDPNDIALSNGTIYGLPFSEDEASVILLPVPWEVTVSYGTGTAGGPAAILAASTQVDLYSEDTGDAWRYGIHMLPVPEDILHKNALLREKAATIIAALETGEDRKQFGALYADIEAACDQLYSRISKTALAYLNQDKIVGLVGGDHSVSLGLIQAYAAAGRQFGILHIDAHADLRQQYEGFKYSHASIMHNVLAIPQVSRIVQVGIRDFCSAEAALMREHERITAFTDGYINNARCTGITWEAVCEDIVRGLPEQVYISFDIDGLDPSLCPGTGTPVPGGLSFGDAVYLLGKLCDRGKKIIGFDLVETAVQQGSDWDAVVGARLLYQLCCRAIVSMK